MSKVLKDAALVVGAVAVAVALAPVLGPGGAAFAQSIAGSVGFASAGALAATASAVSAGLGTIANFTAPKAEPLTATAVWKRTDNHAPMTLSTTVGREWGKETKP